ESTQKRIARDRAPRVQISYDVEVGDAIETKELPFVLGVLGDYTGHSREPLPKLKDRKFIQIDGDNFDDVLKGIGPRLALRVDNRLQQDNSQLGVELRFNKLEDFGPAQVAAQVEPLRRLLEARDRLADLRGKLAGNDRLEELLEQIIHDTGKLRTLSAPATESEG
ncbi:MAG TPA: type VI secretion system contractile sheath small subunit, partial [Holophaga sp.]|nr:type VI secretion system contractile sheath small subunit [Holophaga sp.]